MYENINFFCESKKNGSLWVVSFHTWEDADTDLMICTSEPHDDVKALVDDIENFFCESYFFRDLFKI